MGDITCLLKQGGGWLYLASWQDSCSRKVAGWDVRETSSEDQINEALRRVLAGHRSPPDLLAFGTC